MIWAILAAAIVVILGLAVVFWIVISPDLSRGAHLQPIQVGTAELRARKQGAPRKLLRCLAVGQEIKATRDDGQPIVLKLSSITDSGWVWFEERLDG